MEHSVYYCSEQKELEHEARKPSREQTRLRHDQLSTCTAIIFAGLVRFVVRKTTKGDCSFSSLPAPRQWMR